MITVNARMTGKNGEDIFEEMSLNPIAIMAIIETDGSAGVKTQILTQHKILYDGTPINQSLGVSEGIDDIKTMLNIGWVDAYMGLLGIESPVKDIGWITKLIGKIYRSLTRAGLKNIDSTFIDGFFISGITNGTNKQIYIAKQHIATSRTNNGVIEVETPILAPVLKDDKHLSVGMVFHLIDNPENKGAN